MKNKKALKNSITADLEHSSDAKPNLTTRFVATGIIALVIIVLGMTCRGFYVLRSSSVEVEGHRAAMRVSELVEMIGQKATRFEPGHVSMLGQSFAYLNGIKNTVIYSTDLTPVWPAQRDRMLNSVEKRLSNALLANNVKLETVIDRDFRKIDTWVDGLLGTDHMLPILIKLKDRSGNAFAIARVDYDFKEAIEYARHFGFRVFLFSLICSLLLFLSLYYTFRRGIKTIEQQEEKLNHQISRLSNLLNDNKSLQKSMKTASARAVELNEQFLRRVGADLHDGPAQMIGFAVLRLNQVSKQEPAKHFGHEFHAVREALDESLEEIRGISSGLVLPELEKMSLEECLRKVVTLHGAKSKAEVTQFYQDIPDDIPLPIKICAYRFIQEGLNNAHRHGQAEKCRLSAYAKGDQLVISLKDNGIGFRKSKLTQGGAHLGLVGLKDRVESLGGTFSINSELGIGTALKVNLTLESNRS